MEDIADDKKKRNNNVVPFGLKSKDAKSKKGKKKPDDPINWNSASSDDVEYSRAMYVIDAHSDKVVDLIAQYFRKNEIIDPEDMTLEQFQNMVLIKESVKSLMFRVVGYHHALHDFINNNMKVPSPHDDR